MVQCVSEAKQSKAKRSAAAQQRIALAIPCEQGMADASDDLKRVKRAKGPGRQQQANTRIFIMR